MSEIEIITNSTNKVKTIKRSKSEYVDLIMVILNSITIIYIFTLLSNRTIISNLFGFIFVGIFFIGTFIMFLKRNPFYIWFCYGITLCGLLAYVYWAILFPSPEIMIIFIPQGLYIYSLIDYNLIAEKQPAKINRQIYLYTAQNPNYVISSRRTQKQISDENRRRELTENLRREAEKKFKFSAIAIISICCSIGLFITFILST